MARALAFQVSSPNNWLNAPVELLWTVTQTLMGASVVAPNPPSQEPLLVPVTTTWSTVDPSALFCVVALLLRQAREAEHAALDAEGKAIQAAETARKSEKKAITSGKVSLGNLPAKTRCGKPRLHLGVLRGPGFQSQ